MDLDKAIEDLNTPVDQLLQEVEYRQDNRLWQKTMKKFPIKNENERREIRFELPSTPQNTDPCSPHVHYPFPSSYVQKLLIQGRTGPKKKSPLEKFDEVVTRELTNYRMSEDGGISSFESSKKWSTLQFAGSAFSDFNRCKPSVESKISRSALLNVEKDMKDDSFFDVDNAQLMDAIEKLAQAQAFCRFDAAVKAAEAAIASVPPEKAEEVAVAFAKDYQSEVVDIIDEKIPLSEDKKPIEVIGYIGVTKMNGCM